MLTDGIKDDFQNIYKSDFEDYLSQYYFLSQREIDFLSTSLASIPADYSKTFKDAPDFWNYYLIPINFGIGDFSIVIRIYKLKHILKHSKLNTRNILISNFKDSTYLESNSQKLIVKYKKTTDASLINEEPIIIFKDFQNHFFVIDGNHRVSNAVSQQKRSIKAFVVDESFLIENNCFSSRYDRLLYQCEKIFFTAYKRKGT